MLARIAPSTFFFFNDTATTEIYTLSLHDALPISSDRGGDHRHSCRHRDPEVREHQGEGVSRFDEVRPSEPGDRRSEEHTSEVQSRSDLVCGLLLVQTVDR